MGAIDDIFGPNRMRPDHPDFWRLSEIILGNDARIQDAPDVEAREAAWAQMVANAGDPESINYMFGQRALIALGGGTDADMSKLDIVLAARMATLAIDSFLVGVAFARSQNEGPPAP